MIHIHVYIPSSENIYCHCVQSQSSGQATRYNWTRVSLARVNIADHQRDLDRDKQLPTYVYRCQTLRSTNFPISIDSFPSLSGPTTMIVLTAFHPMIEKRQVQKYHAHSFLKRWQPCIAKFQSPWRNNNDILSDTLILRKIYANI